MVCSGEYPQVCVECSHVVDKTKQQQVHFKELKRCRARQCSYETYCPFAMDIHTALSTCSADNRKRWIFGKPVNYKALSASSTLQCTKCEFSSSSGDAMSKHLAFNQKCFGSTATVMPIERDGNESALPEEENEDARLEREYLGLDRLENITPLAGVKRETGTSAASGSGADESAAHPPTIMDRLANMLPLLKLNHFRNDGSALRLLVENELSTEIDEEPLKLLASEMKSMLVDDIRYVCKLLPKDEEED